MKSTRWRLLLLAIVMCRPSATAFAQGYPPEEAVRRMSVAEGFAVDLVAAEPQVRQPVAIDFDDRGRLWVLQYLQYPNPAGLKRVKVDRYSRTTYDRVPKPPPHGPKGADRLTILEDTDGDGRVDKAKDFLSDLNIATGFQFGYGGVFVLQTPYLLFYADRDGDDVPDGDPEVLLKGFGMEDASSLANSLVWGPDGWLYGTQGTNITANIRGVEFEQGLWRYHPRTKQFELFAEGASNMWGLDFDRKGNLLAGTNYGGYIMFHAVQGAYYRKSFAKHGELHNPFAFGFLEHVPHQNFQGGHVTVGGFVYQGDSFPHRFRDKYIAVDTLGHAVRWHTIKPLGSTLQSENGGVLVQANDTWFAPSDAVMGPNGAVYIADWHDQRTAHPDPDATWDRSNGRIYRLRWKTDSKDAGQSLSRREPDVNPQSLSNAELIGWLRSSNEWRTRRARRVLAERDDRDVIAPLEARLRESRDAQETLQMLWTLHAVGGLNNQRRLELLQHRDPAVRAWTIRLLADDRGALDDLEENHRLAIRKLLVRLAMTDNSPVVIRQLASTAKRIPAHVAIPIVDAIVARGTFQSDPYIPLLTWWAVEHHAVSAMDEVLRTFVNVETWQRPFASEVILGRLMRRWAGEGSAASFAACAQLLKSAPDEPRRRRILSELDTGLKLLGRQKQPRLPLPDSDLAVKRPKNQPAARRLEAMPAELAAPLSDIWSDDTTDPLIVRVSARLGSQRALDRAVALAMDRSQSEKTRMAMLAILQELGDSKTCVTSALRIVKAEAPAIRLAALRLLERFEDDRITRQLLRDFPTMDSDSRSRACDVLLGRVSSAMSLLELIDRGEFPASEITREQLRRAALHENADINALVRKHWGTIRAGTPEEKLAEIRRIKNDLRAKGGRVDRGKLVFNKQCATCHRLFGVGKTIGPDLTEANRADLDFLLVSMVDPNAQIRKEYLSYVIRTNDGRVMTGLLVEDSPAVMTLLGAKGERTMIARESIAEIKVSPVSLMPENQLSQLQPQQVRDLFQYLQSRLK